MDLYKYIGASYCTDIIEHHRVRFTQPECFNDPFEAFPHIREVVPPDKIRGFFSPLVEELLADKRQLRAMYERALSEYPRRMRRELKLMLPYKSVVKWLRGNAPPRMEFLLQKVLDTMKERIGQGIREQLNTAFGILSLSEKPDDILMWGHYADSHRGIVLGFNGEDSFFDQRVIENDLIRHVCKVAYSEDRPSVTVFDPDANQQEAMENLAAAFFLTKGKEWEYEKEWRMILPLNESTDVIAKDTGAVHLFAFPPRCLTAVILGCRIADEQRHRISTILKERSEYTHVSLCQADLDPGGFRVNIIDMA